MDDERTGRASALASSLARTAQIAMPGALLMYRVAEVLGAMKAMSRLTGVASLPGTIILGRAVDQGNEPKTARRHPDSAPIYVGIDRRTAKALRSKRYASNGARETARRRRQLALGKLVVAPNTSTL